MAANDQSEIKKLLTEIHSVISKVASAGKQQIDVNRQLLKVMTVIDSGFAKSADDAKELVAGVTGALEDGALVSDDFIKKWAKARKAQKKDLDDLTKRFKEIDEISEDTIENSKTYIDLLKQQHGLIDDEVDLTKKLLANHEAIVRAVSQAKKEVNKFGGSLSNSEQIINELVAKKTDLSGMFGGVNESVVNAMGLVEKMQSDINTMVGNVSGQIIDFKLNFNPITGELNDEVAKILNSVKLEKDARLDGLKQYFAQNDKLQKNATRGRALEDLQQNVKFNVEAPDFDKIIGTSQISIDVNTGEIQTATGILKEGTKQYEQLISRLDEIAANNKITDKLKVDFDEIVNLIQLGTSRTAEQEKALRSLTVPLGISTQLLTDQIRLQYDEIDAINSQVEAQTRIHKTMASYMGQLEKAEKAVLRIGSGFDYVNAMLPAGIGDFLGISKVSAVLLDSHQKGAKAFSDEISRGGDSASALNSYFKQMEPAISLALNPMTMLIASVVLLGTFVSSVVEKYKDMAANMKISLLQAKELLNIQLDILSSQKNQFISMQDIQDVQTAMIGSSGVLLDLQSKSSKDLVISLSEIGKAFGYGNEQAVKLHKVFSNLGADDKLAVKLQSNLGYMAEMAGLSPQIVTDDLIDSADAVATYFAGMPDKAAKAVIQVRRMGLSLKQAGDIAQKMLDLEGFMTDMYELQSMSNGGVDFSKAFDKGLMGDIEGMTKEIMENIGSTAKYDKMDYLTRMKVAKTLGMSVDELGKSVNLHEKMNGMTEDQQKYLNANLDRMGDISAMSQSDIKNRLQQLQATDRLGVAWDKIKAVLVKSILPLVESFASVIDMISPVLDIVVFGFKSIAAAIGVVTKVVSYILTPLSMVGNGISGLIGKFDAVSDSVNGLGEFASGALKILGGLATIGIGTMIFKSIGMLKNGLFSLIEMIPGIGKIFTGMGNIIGGMFGGIGKKSADAIGESKTSVETLNTNVKTSIGDMVTSVKTAMGEITTSIQNTFSKLSGATGKGIDTTSQQMQRVVGDISAKTAQSNQSIASETEKSTNQVKKSLESTTKDGMSRYQMFSVGVKTSIGGMVTSVKTSMGDIATSVQTTFNKLSGSTGKGIDTTSQQMQQAVTQIANKTAQTGQTISTETEKSSNQVKKSLESTTKGGLAQSEMLNTGVKTSITNMSTSVKASMGEITTSVQTTFNKLNGTAGKGIASASQQMQQDISAKTTQSNQTIVAETEKSSKKMQKSLESTTKGGLAQSEMLNTGVKTSIDNMVTSVKTAMNEIVVSIQTTFNKLNGTAVKGINSNSQKMQQVVGEIASTTVHSGQTIATETEKSTKKVKKSLSEATSDGITKVEELQKTAKKGIFSSDTAKSTFGTIGKIGAASLSGMAAGYIGKLMGIGKAVEGATGEATQASLGQFDAMFGIAGAMATQYLGEGIERVFRKKLEGSFEEKFEPVLKKARKGLGKLEEPLVGAFKNAGQEGQSVFQKIGSFAKNIFGKKLEPEIDTKQITKTTETISDVTNKVQELATSKTTDVAENIVRNKTEEITEQLPQKKEKVKLPEPDAPIKKIKSSDKTISLPDVDPKQEKQLTGKLSGISDFIKSAFSNLGSVLKSVWQTIKGTLTEITKFVADTMKTLSAGIGTSIKNVLKGIGDGLSSFKTSAVKGAASLIIVSGALWITSKAFQNFAGVNWGDVGKGIVTLGSLTVAALMLGKISGQVIIGAAAIALLGASLIPAAYALNQFNEVDWSSLAKAGVALIGLGVIGSVMSGISPALLLGSVAIAAIGASLIPLAFALEKFNNIGWEGLAKAGVALVAFGATVGIFGMISPVILAGAMAIGAASVALILFSGSLITLNASMKELNPAPLLDLGSSLMELTKVSVSSLFGLSAGLISISGAMFTLNAISGSQSLFGGGFVKDLQIVGNLANPLYIVANSIGSLVTNLIDLTKVLENVDLTNIEKLKNFDEIGVDAKITRQIEPLTEIQPKVERDNTQVKISPTQTPLVKPFAPSKQSVAQDVQVKEPKRESVAQDVKIEYPKFNQNNIQQDQFEKQKSSDNYSNDEIGDLSKVEMLLMKLNQLMELQLKQQLVVHMDGQRVGNIIRTQNNN